MNGIDFHVVGVAPPDFTGVEDPLRPAFYVPLAMAARLAATPTDPLEQRDTRLVLVKGRLESGVSKATAQAELATLWKGLQRAVPEPQSQSDDGGAERDRGAHSAGPGGRDPVDHARSAGGSRPDHRVRERRESDAEQDPRALARDRHPSGAGRQPRAARASAVDGKPAPGAPGLPRSDSYSRMSESAFCRRYRPPTRS